jgi:hypothetical protein
MNYFYFLVLLVSVKAKLAGDLLPPEVKELIGMRRTPKAAGRVRTNIPVLIKEEFS